MVIWIRDVFFLFWWSATQTRLLKYHENINEMHENLDSKHTASIYFEYE